MSKVKQLLRLIAFWTLILMVCVGMALMLSGDAPFWLSALLLGTPFVALILVASRSREGEDQRSPGPYDWDDQPDTIHMYRKAPWWHFAVAGTLLGVVSGLPFATPSPLWTRITLMVVPLAVFVVWYRGRVKSIYSYMSVAISHAIVWFHLLAWGNEGLYGEFGYKFVLVCCMLIGFTEFILLIMFGGMAEVIAPTTTEQDGKTCPSCLYDLTNNTSGQCPECGEDITEVVGQQELAH